MPTPSQALTPRIRSRTNVPPSAVFKGRVTVHWSSCFRSLFLERIIVSDLQNENCKRQPLQDGIRNLS